MQDIIQMVLLPALTLDYLRAIINIAFGIKEVKGWTWLLHH